MVRTALSLSLLVSLLALAGLHTMDDPKPWVNAPGDASATQPQAAAAQR